MIFKKIYIYLNLNDVIYVIYCQTPILSTSILVNINIKIIYQITIIN